MLYLRLNLFKKHKYMADLREVERALSDLVGWVSWEGG